VALVAQSKAADVTKANNSTTLTNGSSWVSGTAPGPSDVAVFGTQLALSSYANTLSPAPVGGNLSIQGILVAGPTLGQADSENGIVITNAFSGGKVTIGAAGIDLSATNAVPLEIQSQIALSASQTWNISDASSRITNPPPVLPLPTNQTHFDRYTAFDANEDEDLYFNAMVAGTPFDLGGFTLTLTNIGSTVIDQGYTVTNGTINVSQGTLAIQGGKDRQTTISSNVTINVAGGATLRLQTTSGALVSSAAINLADGSLLNLTAAGTQGTGAVSNSITISGNATISQTQNPIVGGDNSITNVIAASIIGASSATLNLVPSQSGSGTCLLQLAGDNSGFNGAVNVNATAGIRPVLLSKATAGSANAAWTIGASNVIQVAGVSVGLGSLSGAGTLSNSVAATTAALNVGAGNFTGVIANAGTALMALNKISSSTLTLGGANTYTGPTAVSNGTLLVDGSIASPVTVYSGGTLGGTGTLRSNVLGNAGCTVAPGSPVAIGTLTISGALTNNGATFIKINPTNATTSDLLACAKTIKFGGPLTVSNLGTDPQIGETFTLFSAAGYSGSFSSMTLPALPADRAWNTSSLLSNGTLSVVALPVITSLTPLNPIVECAGGLTFSVTATGQALDFQWSVNGTPVNGQTANTFSLPNIHFPSPITVSVTVSNTYGAAVSNSIVIVQDTTPPVITLNGANPLTVECHGSFTDPGATANDACSGVVPVRVSGTVNTTATGTYYLTYTADDGNGNTNSAVRTVNVVDTTPPVITYAFTNLVLGAGINCSALMPDVTGTNYIVASDICSGSNLIITQTPTNNTILPLGTNTVVIAVADASGNTSFSTNTVVVQDQTPPVITLNGLETMIVECHGAFSDPGATANDACTGPAAVRVSGTVNAAATGTYYLTYTADDGNGNTNSVVRTVDVVDTTPPVITYSFAKLVLSVGINCSALMPDVTGTNYIVASDACSGSSLTITQTPTNNTVLPLGTNTVVIAVADLSGNTSYSTNAVVVLDQTPPVITLEGSASMSLACNSRYAEPGATATDNCTLASFSTNGVVNVNVPGVYTITYVAVDAAGNSATSTRTVTVVGPPQPPVLASGTMLPNRTFQLVFSGPSNETYRVLSSTDLAVPVSSWVPMFTNIFGQGPTNYIDTAATNYGVRYYRLQAPAP
jgi:autotransporter-associated beta strand protein